LQVSDLLLCVFRVLLTALSLELKLSAELLFELLEVIECLLTHLQIFEWLLKLVIFVAHSPFQHLRPLYCLIEIKGHCADTLNEILLLSFDYVKVKLSLLRFYLCGIALFDYFLVLLLEQANHTFLCLLFDAC